MRGMSHGVLNATTAALLSPWRRWCAPWFHPCSRQEHRQKYRRLRHALCVSIVVSVVLRRHPHMPSTTTNTSHVYPRPLPTHVHAPAQLEARCALPQGVPFGNLGPSHQNGHAHRMDEDAPRQKDLPTATEPCNLFLVSQGQHIRCGLQRRHIYLPLLPLHRPVPAWYLH